MGFKCPNCHKDFGTDKKALDDHILSSPICAVYSATVLSTIKDAIASIREDNH